MESDLPLIEISGEDDSLLTLQHSPIVSNDSPFFSCSPLLHFPRSTEFNKDDKDTSKTTPSTSGDVKDNNTEKENANANASEAPKSVEPQLLKRKKKGGGFNMRKSLAWNRAFFTEEGVLDPQELSMLSGSTLSVIHEGRESLSSELDGPSVSPGLKALEQNLFKELPSSARKGSRIAGKTSPKLVNSARKKIHPASLQDMKGMKFTTMSKTPPRAKRKILSAQDINRSASKRSGCPRPVASPSLKRASTTSATNVTNKEPRVSKQQVTKNEPLAVPATSRSSVTSATHTKLNVTSKPAAGQKNIAIKGTSSIARSSRKDPKSVPAGKLIKGSTAQPGRSMVKVATELGTFLSSSLQLPQVTLANNGLEGLSDPVVPAAAHQLNVHDSTSRKNAISLPQSTLYYGGNMQQTQTQLAKPSGLRMPSPSIGFFGQLKSSNSQSELQKGHQPCNPLKASIPTISKAGVINSIQRRPPQPSRKVPTCSGTMQSVTLAATNVASCGIIKSESELSDFQKESLLLQVNSDSTDIANGGQKVHDADLKSPDDGKPSEQVENLSCIENLDFPKESGPCAQLEKDDGKCVVDVCPRSRDSTGVGLDLLQCASPLGLLLEVEGRAANNTSAKQQVEDMECEPIMKSFSFSPESHTSSMTDKTGLEVHVEQVSGLHEFELSLHWKHGTCKVDPTSEIQSQRPNGTLMEYFRSSKNGDKDYISNSADDVLEVQDCGAVSCSPAHKTETEPTKDESCGTGCLKGESRVGEEKMLSLESTLLVGSCNSLTDTSAADLDRIIFDSPSAKSAERTETLSSCVISEQVSQHNCESPSNGCFEHGKCSVACPSETNDIFFGQQVEDRKCEPYLKSYSVSPESHTANMSNNLYEIGSEVHTEQLSGLDEFDLSPQQVELKKPDSYRIDPVSDIQIPRLDDTFMADCRSPEKDDKVYISNAGDFVLGVQHCNALSYSSAHSAETKPTKDETSGTDSLDGEFDVKEVQMPSVKSTLLAGSCKSPTNSLAEDSNWMIFDIPSVKSAEKTEIMNSCLLSEQVSQDNCEPTSQGHLLNGKHSEESQEKNILLNVNCAELRASDLCSLSSLNQGCNFAAKGEVECLHVENAFTATIDDELLLTNSSHSVEDNALELDTEYKSDMICEIINNNIVEENSSQNSGYGIGSELESSSQVDIASGINDTSLHGAIDDQCDLSKINLFFSDSQQEASNSPEKETFVLFGDSSTDMREHDAGQATLIGPCSHEIEQVNDDAVGKENGSFVDAIFIDGCGSEVDEVADIDNMSEKSFKEDALLHFIAESSLAHSNNSYVDYSLVVDDKSGRLKQDSELQNVDQVPLENARQCPGDNLLLEFEGKDIVEDVLFESDSFVAVANVPTTKPSSNKVECYRDCDDQSYDEPGNKSCPLNSGSSSNAECYQIPLIANYESSSSSLIEKTNGTSNGSTQKNVHEPLECEINIHRSNISCENQLLVSCDVHSEEVKDAVFSSDQSVEDKTRVAPTIEIPPKAVPFSDEWLASLEAAGEEILSRKGGAVQNSPPDKSLPEPGPWSPVKRKNNQGIGPFDCTKLKIHNSD